MRPHRQPLVAAPGTSSDPSAHPALPVVPPQPAPLVVATGIVALQASRLSDTFEAAATVPFAPRWAVVRGLLPSAAHVTGRLHPHLRAAAQVGVEGSDFAA